MSYIYVVSGGALRKGVVKIGHTTNREELIDRYSTYYGDDCEISYAKNPENENVEADIHSYMRQNYDLCGVELYYCAKKDVTYVIKCFTGCERLCKCKRD